MTRTILASLVATSLVFASAANAAGVFVIHHKVHDYAKWRPAFDGDKANQEAAGLTNPRLYHSHSNPNDVTIVFDAADLDKAKEFSRSKALKEKMKAAGVEGKPTFEYLDSEEH